jgi:hypothetical protein
MSETNMKKNNHIDFFLAESNTHAEKMKQKLNLLAKGSIETGGKI